MAPTPVIPERIEPIVVVPHTGVDNEAVFARDAIVKSVVFPGARQEAPDVLSLPDATAEEEANAGYNRSQRGLVSDQGFYFGVDCRLRGRGFLMKGDRRLYAPDLVPDYVEAEINRGVRTEVYEKPDRQVRPFEGTTVVLTSEGYPIYGHWLVDMLPKAWLYRSFLGTPLRDPRYLFCSDTPGYGLDLFTRFFDIPSAAMEFYEVETEEPLLERVLAPSLMHNSHVFHPALADMRPYLVDRARRHVAAVDIPRAAPATGRMVPGLRRIASSLVDKATSRFRPKVAPSRRLFVSRGRFRTRSISSPRLMANEEALAAIASAHGFEIVYPEEHSFEQQAILFSEASVVVGESGSGLHNTIFSPRGAVVLCISPSTQVQGTIAALLGHRLMLMAPENSVDQDGIRTFWVNEERFEAALLRAVGRP